MKSDSNADPAEGPHIDHKKLLFPSETMAIYSEYERKRERL